MFSINKLKKLVDKFTATYLMLGVQPSDLATAIFDDPYTDIVIQKKDNRIVLEISYFDELDDKNSIKNMMKYTYDLDGKILSIEEKIDRSRYKMQWNREEKIKNILALIKECLLKISNEAEIYKIFNTLPSDIKQLIEIKLSLAA